MHFKTINYFEYLQTQDWMKALHFFYSPHFCTFFHWSDIFPLYIRKLLPRKSCSHWNNSTTLILHALGSVLLSKLESEWELTPPDNCASWSDLSEAWIYIMYTRAPIVLARTGDRKSVLKQRALAFHHWITMLAGTNQSSRYSAWSS